MQKLATLPSLNALRVFEAAARHRSFAHAAEELHVTPGAVSHQIAALENTLGVQLFHRDARGVDLTAAAQACLPVLTSAFQTLRESLRILQADRPSGPLTVSVAPGFASRWLLPRLSHFTDAHPEIELQLSTGLGLIDAVRPEASSILGEKSDHDASADLSIRFGRGVYAGCRSDLLLAATVTPVCSPRLMQGPHPLATPDDLRHHLLLHDDTFYFDDRRPDWQVWLEAAGVTGIDTARGPRFSHSALAMDAATDGLGVALGLTLLAEQDVADGRLAMPFALALPSYFSYYLVYPEGSADRPQLAAFRTWLLDEARSFEAGAAASRS